MYDALLWLMTLLWPHLLTVVAGIMALVLTVEVISRVKEWIS